VYLEGEVPRRQLKEVSQETSGGNSLGASLFGTTDSTKVLRPTSVCQEALVPDVGDQIQVMGTKVDQPTRSGVVTDVRGRMVTVQWTTGDQSVFVPAPGAVTVLGRASAKRAPVRKTPRKSVAKATTRQPAKKVVTKATGRNGPAPKASKRASAQGRTTVTKGADRR
jgi:hypothetical protein